MEIEITEQNRARLDAVCRILGYDPNQFINAAIKAHCSYTAINTMTDQQWHRFILETKAEQKARSS